MTNKKLAYWLLTSLAVLSLVACQKQETSSVVSESSSQSVAKSTNTSSSAKKSEKKSSSEASSKTTEDNSSETAAESVTAESVEESVEDSAASSQFQPIQSETYVDTYSADYGLSYSEGEVWTEEYTSSDYDVVEETADYATVYHEPTEEEAVAIVQQMMADIPSRAEAVVQYGNTGLGGWYSPTVAAEMERQGYWEQFNQTVADLQNAQNQ